nr:phage protein Gp37 [Chromobacterium sp. ASV5]
MSLLIPLQTAIADRLQQGLGRMVREVAADLDETAVCGLELDHGGCRSRLTPGRAAPALHPQALARLPAVWTVAGGIVASRPAGNQRQRYKTEARFTVLAGDRLHADAGYPGAGVWALVYAVRRLLSAQDFSLPVAPLLPEQVRPLGQAERDGEPWSLMACDFSSHWLEDALDNGRWPSPQGEADPDALFARFGGRLDGPQPEWLRTRLDYAFPADAAVRAQDAAQRAKPR